MTTVMLVLMLHGAASPQATFLSDTAGSSFDATVSVNNLNSSGSGSKAMIGAADRARRLSV